MADGVEAVLKEVPMAKHVSRTGKQDRPKTAEKGKRYHCAKCRKRSPKPVKTPAPWYCKSCLAELDAFRKSPPAAPELDQSI